MKLFAILSLLVSGPLFAATDVTGKIFYKLPNGNLVSRAATIQVPSRGQGEVVLKGENFEWKTTVFSSKEAHGQQIFEATFPVEWQGESSQFKFIGTYIRAENKIVYYGDFYKLKNNEVKHGGGFAFKYDRQASNDNL
jgi:hypothetical protein